MTITPVLCECGAPIGSQVESREATMLKVNSMLLRALHGVCGDCGREIHWTVSDILMQRILSKIEMEES